jgi:hypothetical protein
MLHRYTCTASPPQHESSRRDSNVQSNPIQSNTTLQRFTESILGSFTRLHRNGYRRRILVCHTIVLLPLSSLGHGSCRRSRCETSGNDSDGAQYESSHHDTPNGTARHADFAATTASRFPVGIRFSRQGLSHARVCSRDGVGGCRRRRATMNIITTGSHHGTVVAVVTVGGGDCTGNNRETAGPFGRVSEGSVRRSRVGEIVVVVGWRRSGRRGLTEYRRVVPCE